MMGLGTVVVMLAIFLIVPGASLLGKFDSDPRSSLGELRLVGWLHRLSESLDHFPKRLLAFLLIAMSMVGVGMKFLTVETDFSKNFRDESEIVKALEFFENRLGGAGNWEVVFTGPEVLNAQTMEPIRKLADDLRQMHPEHGGRLTKVIAVTDGVDLVPGIGVDAKLLGLKVYQPDFLPSLYHPETHQMRIVLRSLERQPAEVKLALISDVLAKTREVYPDAEATGLYVLLSNLIISVLRDQAMSSLSACLCILACMTIAFRNLWIGLISLIPNIFPLLVVMGGMGWFQIPINIGTAMIACVSLGLTVDSSIHYLYGYLEARRKGASHEQATRATHGQVGLSLVFTNIALVFGFLVLMLSNFVPLIYFGLMVSLSMFGGLIGNLVLLPLLLRWIPIRP